MQLKQSFYTIKLTKHVCDCYYLKLHRKESKNKECGGKQMENQTNMKQQKAKVGSLESLNTIAFEI